MTPQLSISKGKTIFNIGETVMVKPHSEKEFIGEISKIEGNFVGISIDNVYVYNYSIKQIFKLKN